MRQLAKYRKKLQVKELQLGVNKIEHFCKVGMRRPLAQNAMSLKQKEDSSFY